jgi:flagellar biosynthetic protein FliR
MTNILSELLGDQLVHFSMVFLRVGAFSILLPALGEVTVPIRFRLAIALSLSVFVAPLVPAVAQPTHIFSYVAFMAVEITTGVFMGLILRLFLLGLQTAGAIAAQSTSLSQLLGGANPDPVPALGFLLVVAGLAVITALGIHVRAVEFIVLTYQVFPPGQPPSAAVFTPWSVQQIARVFSLALILSAPFYVGSLIYNLALGVINRAMPQLMVAFVGAPFVTWGSIVLLLAAGPIIVQFWAHSLLNFVANPLRVF